MASGFGFVNKSVSSPFAITVSDQLDYEISFWFYLPNNEPSFELSVNCFDCQLQTELIPIDVVSGASQKIIIPGNVQICGTPNKWNFLHSVIYSSNESIHAGVQPETSHAAGTNLIMKKGTSKLFVNLTCIKNCMLIWGFAVKPLRTMYSTGFIQASGLLEIWRKNNKKNMTQDQIDQLAQRFLLPDDTNMIVTEL